MTLKIVGATKADWKIIIPEISPDKKIKMELIGNYSKYPVKIFLDLVCFFYYEKLLLLSFYDPLFGISPSKSSQMIRCFKFIAKDTHRHHHSLLDLNFPNSYIYMHSLEGPVASCSAISFVLASKLSDSTTQFVSPRLNASSAETLSDKKYNSRALPNQLVET